MSGMSENVRHLRSLLDKKRGEMEAVERIIASLEEKIEREEIRRDNLEKALEIVKHVGLETQRQLEYHLSEQVSLAMEAVFDDPYELRLRFEDKRGQTEVQILFARGELEFPPIGSAGGGTIDVASLALRMAYWSMRTDANIRPTLILDEPFSQVKGAEANRRALEMVHEISHRLGVQVITVSDERVDRETIVSAADKVFSVSNKKGVSKVDVVK